MKHPEDTPDPSGEPIAIDVVTPDTSKDSVILSGVLGIMGAGALGAFVLIGMTPHRAKGASSDARLDWLKRQAAIEQAIQQQTQSNPQPSVNHE